MKQIIKKLLILYFIVLLIKISLSFIISSPAGFWDEYIYSKLARSLHFYNSLSLTEGTPSQFYPPLYPLILSLFYYLNDMQIIYFLMKILNSIISSIVIIPAYLLSKEFLDEKQTYYITILISLLPITFFFSNYILAENLFYPLFLSSIYFIYKSLKDKTITPNILAGLFISLTFLTKNLGLILIPIYILSHIANKIVYKERLQIKNLILCLILILLIISPWLIRNYTNFGPGVKGIFEDTAKDNLEALLQQRNTPYLIPLLNWIIIYSTSLVISSGLLFFFSSFFAFRNIKNQKNTKYFILVVLISTILYILVLSNNSVGTTNENLPEIFKYFTDRPITRYIDILAPLILILGSIGLNNFKRNEDRNSLKKLVLFNIPFFIISSQLTLSQLFPINNPSMTIIGSIQKLIEFLFKGVLNTETSFILPVFIIMLIIFTLIPFTILLLNKLNFKKIFYLILSFFILTALINFSVSYYKSENWSRNEQLQLGLWFNENDKEISNILFDINNSGNPFNNSKALFEIIKEDQYNPQYVAFSGFWMNDNLFFNEINKTENIDYIITTSKLNYKLVKQTDNFKVYKI